MNMSDAGRLGYIKSKIIFEKRLQDRITNYGLNPAKCKNCNTSLDYIHRHNKFCSKSCSATCNNSGIRRHGNAPGHCLTCDKSLKSYRQKFCSQVCANKHKSYKAINDWQTGRAKAYTGKTLMIKAIVRRYLKNKAGNICSRCGWDAIHPITKTCPLEINHIDGNAKNCKLSNLEVLCPNCHALTPNFRNLNKNSKRNRAPIVQR